jgi:hypothetical protein
MTSRRVQLGILVKERKKYESRFGKVVAEIDAKKWSVQFFPTEELEERKSAQLTVVKESDAPQEVLVWFRTGRLGVVTAPIAAAPIAAAPALSPVSPDVRSKHADHEKENPSMSPSSPPPPPVSTPRRSLDDSDVSDSEDQEECERSDILGTTRRKSLYGRSVRRGAFNNSTPSRSNRSNGHRRVVLFSHGDDSDSDSESGCEVPSKYQDSSEDSDYCSVGDGNEADDAEEDDLIMTPERLLALDDELAQCLKAVDSLASAENNQDLQRAALKHIGLQRRADEEKEALIGSKVLVRNGEMESQWRVIKDINSVNSITAKRRPQEEIGVIDLDFNQLPEADYPLVEVLLRFWPGNAFRQLAKLNQEFRKRYPGKPLVTLKEFFTFFACLLAACPAGYGGERLWKPPLVKSIFPHPQLNTTMTRNRFNYIKSCFAAAFAYGPTDVVKEGEEWAPIDDMTPGDDPWAQMQGLVNDFNKTTLQNFSPSDEKVIDESMSPFKPRQSKKANLPHLSFVKRKPKPHGTEFKCIACGESGIMLKLEIQRGKVSLHLTCFLIAVFIL